MAIKLQPGDYFEIAKLAHDQYHEVCQAMIEVGASMGEYCDGYVNWGNHNYVGISSNLAIRHWNYPNTFSNQSRLLTYADIFGNDEGDAHDYADSTTDELIHEIRRMREEVRRRCKDALGLRNNA